MDGRWEIEKRNEFFRKVKEFNRMEKESETRNKFLDLQEEKSL